MSRESLSSQDSDRESVLIMIGSIVLMSQTAERVIRLCLTFVLQRDSPLTWEKFQRQEVAERRKTLGYFLTELRKRAEVDETFDDLLVEFLDNRNTLIHNIDEIDGWNLNSREGLAVARNYCGRLAFVTWEVLKTFVGLVRAWQLENDWELESPEGPEDLWSEIDEEYAPLVNSVFGMKPD